MHNLTKPRPNSAKMRKTQTYSKNRQIKGEFFQESSHFDIIEEEEKNDGILSPDKIHKNKS